MDEIRERRIAARPPKANVGREAYGNVEMPTRDAIVADLVTKS